MREDQPVGSGYLSRDVAVLSDLVRTLSTRLSSQHESTEKMQEAAESILELEQEQLAELVAELGYEPDTDDDSCIVPRVVQIERENISLEQQLQRLQFVGTKSHDLLKQYMSALEMIVSDSQIYAADMDNAASQITKSYEEHDVQSVVRKQELLDEQEDLKKKLVEIRRKIKESQEM